MHSGAVEQSVYNFIEAMIKGHNRTEYRWISGKCRNKCVVCDSNNNSIETMQYWQADVS